MNNPCNLCNISVCLYPCDRWISWKQPEHKRERKVSAKYAAVIEYIKAHPLEGPTKVANLLDTKKRYVLYIRKKLNMPPLKPGRSLLISDKSRAIIEYRKKNPCLDMQTIASRFGVSRERIRQILKKAHVATSKAGWSRSSKCPQCGGPRYSKGLCMKCSKANHRIQVSCSYCGNLTEKTIFHVTYCTSKRGYNHFFCNRLCQGKWFAENYGFTAHPENIVKGATTRRLNKLKEVINDTA